MVIESSELFTNLILSQGISQLMQPQNTHEIKNNAKCFIILPSWIIAVNSCIWIIMPWARVRPVPIHSIVLPEICLVTLHKKL